MNKRIITCSDGTWNKFGNSDRGCPVKTNVEKMYNSICAKGPDGVKQCKIYDEGVGTGYTWQDRLFGGLTGAGIDMNIKDVYTFILLNYSPGDEIFLFGFSRGAYTARSIAGLIRNCGILKAEYINLVDKAYGLYRDRNEYTHPDSDLMKSFRRNYCQEDVTPIKFIGVWDTVGSLGIPLPWFKLYNKNKYKFHDVTLGKTIEHAYHGLALDDKRVLFTPSIWEPCSTVKADPKHPQVLEQRWFAGVHSNVGGGYADCGLSDIALRWLIDRSKKLNLCFDEVQLQGLEQNHLGELRNSYTWKYWFWPPKIRTVTLKDGTNQVIDESVKQRMDEDGEYRPKNLKMLWPIKERRKAPDSATTLLMTFISYALGRIARLF
ncbi:DUF2235 domain-containing protein [Rufibacter psychrotolerans]|uniref:DUF2235 domain-containing protein n=1 Tax=Rufibacter psychrotolerans TaxID=2812556 RepID=UPI001968670D|nr:DUF2235 domain-containing protein [Rufibacter sp. SYSU D00308]